MKVLFYTNIPSPYRVAFFNELGKYCELTVVFETATSTERDDAWKKFEFKNFKGIILKGIRTRVDAAFCPGIIKYLKKDAYDHIVVTQLASLTAIWAVAYMRMKGIEYYYEGDGGFVGSIRGIKASLKRFIIKNAKICFSTAKEFDKYCIAYGAKLENIYRYPFTSIFDSDVIDKSLSKDEKIVLKKKLNMKEETVLLSVGRFIQSKGFDLLLEVSRQLSANIGIYIVGGEPTAEYLEMQKKWNLRNVHFLDFMKKEQLAEYYQASDVFVLPTRSDVWGLVVNEAMANGLPVVSTDKCIAALEMIENWKNGFVVPVDDAVELKNAIEYILKSPDVCQQMAKESLETVRKYYTIECMAREHLKVFLKR